MGRCSGSSRRIIDFARASLGIGDELGNRLSRDRWIYRHDKWCADNASDWRDIADEIVVEPKLNKEINAGLADPNMKTRLAALGGTVLASSPARPCSVAETAPVRGLRFFTRVAAVHLRQTMTGWLRLRRS